LQNFLDDRDGKVLNVQIVPPFANIFEIEVKIRELKDLNMFMLYDDQQRSRYWCVPRDLQDSEKYEAKFELYEE
jgi:hypothetical protein